MHPAIKEIEQVNRKYDRANVDDDATYKAFESELQAVINKHGCKRELVKALGNGLGKYRVIDRDGVEIMTSHGPVLQ